MKTTVSLARHMVFTTLSVLLTAGCSERQAPSPESTPTQIVNAKKDSALTDLEASSGLSFPTNAVLLSSGDGGGREPGFREWVIYSPSPIRMPPTRAAGVKDYLNMPLADSVKFVESRMKKRKIQQPQAAFDSSWQTSGFGFTGTLVRSTAGDYLVLVRGPL